MHQLPVDLWVMDVEDDEDFERVKAAASALFANRFEWGGPLSGLPRKGVVREIDEDEARRAHDVLEALGARMLIDDGAYVDLERPERDKHLRHLAAALEYETRMGGWLSAWDLVAVIVRHDATSDAERAEERDAAGVS
jgi:hypothetical protein